LRKLTVALIAVLIITLSLLAVAVAAYVMTAPTSVVVTVNPPGDWSVGPGWN
jgi:hypothetical protein